MMASTRDEFNSESGSNVFSPFSLKDSMMFQMSTRDKLVFFLNESQFTSRPICGKPYDIKVLSPHFREECFGVAD